MTKDGYTDIVNVNVDSTTQQMSISLLVGNGSGDFVPMTTIPLAIVVSSCRQAAISDINNDGWLDVVAVGIENSNFGSKRAVVVTLEGSSGGFRLPQAQKVNNVSVKALSIADVTQDGLKDLVLFGGQTISILANSASGFISDARFPEITATTSKIGFTGGAVSDLTLDGRPDLVAATGESGANVKVYRQQQTGGFSLMQEFSSQSLPAAVTLKDFNGDGASDIAVANASEGGTPSVSLFTNSQGKSFAASQTFSLTSNPVALDVSDLNKDGLADIVTASSQANTVSVLLGIRQNGDKEILPEPVPGGNTVVNTSTGDTTTTAVTTNSRAPRCIVPNVRNLSLTNAKKKLTQSGCALGKVTQKKIAKKRLRILKKKGFRLVVTKQSVSAGQERAANTKINLKLSWKKLKKK